VLLAKTLASSTFKLALIAIGTFGVIVSVIFSYVYLSTSSYVRSRSDRAIMTEYLSLQGAYERSGRDGLIALIQQRIADKGLADNVYILADPSSAVLGGNLRGWPSTVTAARGWTEFRAGEPLPGATNRPLLRAMLETFPSGDRLLVGEGYQRARQLCRSDQDRRDLGRRLDIRAGGGCEHPGDAPHRGTNRIDQRRQPGHHAQRSRQAYPAPWQP
jgi:hypothetical protein